MSLTTLGDEKSIIPLSSPQEIPTDVMKERSALIKRLQTQLRNEEMSLVLLKKIRQSQILAEQAEREKREQRETSLTIQPATVSAVNHQKPKSGVNGGARPHAKPADVAQLKPVSMVRTPVISDISYVCYTVSLGHQV